MTKQLHISKDLSLPLEFVTKTVAILAQRRKGKTYTASVIAEELVAAKQPFVALDPTGAWWGLRASADGKNEGLPVVILGGQHGDVPLERTGGRLIADLVVEQPGYYVIDFSLFESGAAERDFAIDFAERLYRVKGQAGKDFPLHLFVDEADRFVPQQLRKGVSEVNARLLGAFEAIVRRGGLRGLGTTLISQRAAVVNKNVLEMLDILIALRTLGPNDRIAIEGYINAHGTKEQHNALMDSIGSLDIGEAWIWEPGAEPSLFERVRIRERHTFNSSATPKPGEHRVEPRRLAQVDLKVLSERMAATIEKAKATDPKELNKTIAELRGQVRKLEAARSSAEVKTKTEIKTVEKRVVVAGDITRLEKLLERAGKLEESMRDTAHACTEIGSNIRGALDAAARTNEPFQKPDPLGSAMRSLVRGEGGTLKPRLVPTPSVIKRTPKVVVASNGNISMPSGIHLRLVNALAELVSLGITQPSRNQLGFYVGNNLNSGYGSRAVGELKTSGLVDYPLPSAISLTAEGCDSAKQFNAPASLSEFHERVRRHLGGLNLVIFDYLIERYPASVPRKIMGEELDKNFESGYGSRAVGELKTAGLIIYPGPGQVAASDLLFPPGLE